MTALQLTTQPSIYPKLSSSEQVLEDILQLGRDIWNQVETKILAYKNKTTKEITNKKIKNANKEAAKQRRRANKEAKNGGKGKKR